MGSGGKFSRGRGHRFPGDNRATLPEPEQDMIAEIVLREPSYFRGFWQKVLQGGAGETGRLPWLVLLADWFL